MVLPKIMHHCAFLIITFSSSYILCIQNGKTVSSSSPSPSPSPSSSSWSSLTSSSSSSSSVDKLKRRNFDATQPGQSFFHQNEIDNSGFQPSLGPTGFRFPDKHQYNSNSPNELLPPSASSSLSSSRPFGYQNSYTNNREVANRNEGANPHNLALNTGEYSANNANNLNNYPYQQHANAIAGTGFGQHHFRDSPKIPNANDFYIFHQQSPSMPPSPHLNNKNPYYPTPRPNHQEHDYWPNQQQQQRRPTYAQNFGNYLFNGQPNYNRRRATPPPRPPPSQPSSFGAESSYSSYQDGHLTGPYPYNDLTSPSGPSTYPPYQYANQFGNFGSGSGFGTTPTTTTATATAPGTTGSANPLGSLLNSIGGPFLGGNPLSMQIIRGLENIARNDDLQCVPKVLCQMLSSPTRRAQLPSFITSPVLTRFVASLPSFSPALIYGRAALLGLSGGEYSCTRTYNKCPQDEDDILFYLNNHRGGFFKFFSEPDSNLQDAQHQYTTQPPSTQSYQQQQQSPKPSIFNFLTGLGGVNSPSSTSTTTTNTNTNQGNLNTFMSDAVTNGIGSLFGNILSSFLNGQEATRRNDEEEEDDDDIEDIDENPEKYSDLIESNSTTTTNESDEQVEGRILNNKSNILAYAEPVQHQDNPISFPPENGNDNYETQQFQSEFRFPNTPHRDTQQEDDNRDEQQNEDSRRGKRVNFIDSHQDDYYSRPSYGTKMIFPDRTGTGNLRFDNDEYFRVGKILNRPSDYNRGFSDGQRERERERERERYRTTTTTTTRRPKNYYTIQNSAYLDRYASSNYFKHDYNNQNQQQNGQNAEDTSENVYVTNGQGVVEYYINASGKKIYV